MPLGEERRRLFRNVASMILDGNGLEEVHFRALDGSDVIVQGTAAADTVLVSGSTAGVRVLGLSAAVTITGSEAAHDRLTLNLLAGNDLLDASGLIAGLIALTGNGGAGHDVLIGSSGPDVLRGGEGDDVLLGGPGIDVLDGGRDRTL
ncbi:MAG: hypothetical protein M5U12_18605 [Verrucomicrobia bacterium]|nr:hypothetical protein [Verrucomicrobiota bacterium]